MRTLFSNAYVVIMDDAGTEVDGAWILAEDGFVVEIGDGPPPFAEHFENLAGALVTPGLVNTHHHLYQTLTRTRAQEADLFTWLKTLYPLWGRVDADAEYAAARTGLAELVLGGCTTVFDHHYVFPPGRTGLVEAEIQAARELGVRIVASRGSMDVGESEGGLPPDNLVEDMDAVLADTEGLHALHEEGPGAWTQIAVAPLFALLRVEAAHDRVGRARAQARPAAAHAPRRDGRGGGVLQGALRLPAGRVSGSARVACERRLVRALRPPLPADVQAFGSTGTGVAHCPTSNLRLGAGVAPVRAMIEAGVPVGLGVDGSASNERSDLVADVKQALLVARGRGGPEAMTVREALWLGTRGGAQVLGRKDLGSLEPGKCADFAVWNMDGLQFGGADDPVAALILSGPHRAERVYVGGEAAVLEGQLARADEREIAAAHRVQAARFLD